MPDVREFLDKMDRPTTTRYIRVNTLKTSSAELAGRLESKGFLLKGIAIPEKCLRWKRRQLQQGRRPNEYLLGHYYIQDLSSCMMAVEALDIAEGQAFLDIAAVPDGKSTFMGQRMKNAGSIVALEPSERRARSMSFNLTRCGLYNTCASSG
jgi:16S rRNA C967 or C1407 C5-methylase (RsmB/RsmF family)